MYLFFMQLESMVNDSDQHQVDSVIELNTSKVNQLNIQQHDADVIPERSKIELVQIVQSVSGSMALFTVNGGKQQAVLEQQNITGNVLLDKIEVDRVQLKYLNNKELISLGTSQLKSNLAILESDSAINNDQTNVYVKDRALVAFPLGVSSEGVKQLQLNQYVIDRTLVNRQLSKGDVFRHAKFERLDEGGFKLKEIAENSLYDKIGLLEGDVVRQVNGQPINDITDIMILYEQYSHQDQAQLMIDRDGQTEFIYFMLQN